VKMLNVLDKNPDHNGRFARLSNMNAEALAEHAPSLDTAGGLAAPIAGETICLQLLTANNPILLSSTPKIPQMLGGPATIGCLKRNYWNQDKVNALIPDNGRLRYTVLRQPSAGGASAFSGYDQVFVKNSGTVTADRIVIEVNGFTSPLLPSGSGDVAGQLDAGGVWTTTVPAGAFVIVHGSPGITPASQTVNAKATARFTVTAASTNIPLTYQWRHNGADVQNSEKYSGADGPELSIGDCLNTDGGLYACVVTEPGVGSAEIIAPDRGGTLVVSDAAR